MNIRQNIFTNDIQQPVPVAVVSNQGSKKKADTEKLNRLVSESHQYLIKVETVFPFKFFPDTILVDQYKVDIIYGTFIASNQIFSIPIKNINGVTASTDLFFGSISIELNGFNDNPAPIKYLSRSDASRVRRIINGLVACDKEHIDLSKFDAEELVHKVEQIGSAR